MLTLLLTIIEHSVEELIQRKFICQRDACITGNTACLGNVSSGKRDGFLTDIKLGGKINVSSVNRSQIIMDSSLKGECLVLETGKLANATILMYFKPTISH